MRLFAPSLLALICATSAALAQSVSDNLPSYESDGLPPPVEIHATKLPPAPQLPSPSPSSAVVGIGSGSAAPAPVTDPYTVSDVAADVTADTAAHARDQALTQAERAAFVQLCARLNADAGAAKLSDDAVAALVQSFEVQSEKLSAVRYIGAFTIRFKPGAVARRLGKTAAGADYAGTVLPDAARPAVTGPLSHLAVTVQTDSLAAWAQIRRRLGTIPQIASIETLALGRGASKIDLAYGGSILDLQNAVTTQGFVLRQNNEGVWELTDNSMVPR